MDEHVYIAGEKKKLTDFCRKHTRIFLYGAGNYGRGYLDIIQAEHYSVNGFVVTEKTETQYCGKKIYSIEELEENDGFPDGEVGIIPAYADSNPAEIAERFHKIKPDVLDMDHRAMLYLEQERMLCSVMDQLDQEFGVSEKLPEEPKFKNILIIRLDAIGDLVLMTPFIRELKRSYADCKISAVIRTQNKAILENCPYIDELYFYDSGLTGGGLTEQCRLYESTREKVQAFADTAFGGEKFDAVFLPRQLLCGRNALDEVLLAYLCGAKYKIGHILNTRPEKRLIYKRMRDSFSVVFLQGEPIHEAGYTLTMLRLCGCRVSDERLELWPAAESRAFAENVLHQKEIKGAIRVAVGLTASIKARTWKAEHYHRLLELAAGKFGKKIQFVLMGGSDAAEAASSLAHFGDIVIDLTGKTGLDQAAAVMQLCDMYVGSNTGLLHFASAFGKPSVTLYTGLEDGVPTDDSPQRMGAWKTPHIDLLPPAGLNGQHGFKSSIESYYINLIQPEQVIEAMSALWKLLGVLEIERKDEEGNEVAEQGA